MPHEALVCPLCSASPAPGERFCRACGVPLIHGDHQELDDVAPRHARARKIKPQYGEGPLVKVAGARHQAEAELIQGLLLEEGVPSMLRRSRGFDVPDMLAAGPRDVLVPRSGEAVAREALLQADLLDDAATAARPAPWRVLALVLAMVGVVAVLAVVGTALID